MDSTDTHRGWRRWAGRVALAAGGLLVGGVLAGTLTASAANNTSSATTPYAAVAAAAPQRGAVDEPKRQRPDEHLLTGDTASKVRAAALAKYPGATVLRVETDSDGVYEAHLTAANGQRVTVEVGKGLQGDRAGVRVPPAVATHRRPKVLRHDQPGAGPAWTPGPCPMRTIRLALAGADAMDEASEVSRPDPSDPDQLDAKIQSTDPAVGGSRPSRRNFPGRGEVNGYQMLSLAEVPSRVSARARTRALTIGWAGGSGARRVDVLVQSSLRQARIVDGRR
jgi:hypothetical protein